MMFKSVIFAASAIAASVSALPQAESAKAEEPPLEALAHWPVNNFEQDCSSGGDCIAGFNIKSDADYLPGAPGNPGFSVQCRPLLQEGWSVCEEIDALPSGSSVQSQWTAASSDDLARIVVSNIWVEGEARYNATGWIEITPDTKEFEVPVLVATGGL